MAPEAHIAWLTFSAGFKTLFIPIFLRYPRVTTAAWNSSRRLSSRISCTGRVGFVSMRPQTMCIQETARTKALFEYLNVSQTSRRSSTDSYHRWPMAKQSIWVQAAKGKRPRKFVCQKQLLIGTQLNEAMPIFDAIGWESKRASNVFLSLKNKRWNSHQWPHTDTPKQSGQVRVATGGLQSICVQTDTAHKNRCPSQYFAAVLTEEGILLCEPKPEFSI